MDQEYSQQLSELYLSMHGALYQMLLAKYKDPDFVEDIIHDTFAIACTHPKRLFEHPCPEGWFMIAASYVADRKHRLRDNHLIKIGDADAPIALQITDLSDRLDPDVLYEDLSDTKEYKIIRDLADRHLTAAEASREMGITEGAYKMRLSRARKALQKKFRKNEK